MMMKAMLLAAGCGERLRPLTYRTPKCMLTFAGKPLLEHWIDKLSASGIRDLVINVSHLAEKVTGYFGSGDRWGVRIEYSREPALLGTAGAVRQMRPVLGDARFLVIYADNQSDCGLREILDFHAPRRAVATMAVCRIEDPRSCGIVGLAEDGRITRFLEKPTPEQTFSHYINAGIYVLEPDIFEHIPADGTPDFSREVFPRMLRTDAPLYAFCYGGYVLKFDTFADWHQSEMWARKRQAASASKSRVHS